MSKLDEKLQQVITISQVASIAITAIVSTYKFIDDNKEKYQEFFDSALRYMDAMEIHDSPLTGAQKKELVLIKLKELAIDLLFNWDKIAVLVSDLIDDAKSIFNKMIEAKESIDLKLKTVNL